MKLSDLMSDSVAHELPDLTRLAADARRDGSRRRRQRTLLTSSGAALATVAVLGLGYAAGDSLRPDRHSSPPVATSAPDDAAPHGALVPNTGRATVAGLRYAVGQIADGEFAGFRGQGGPESALRDTWGSLELTPADGTGVGVVDLNVQDGSILAGIPFDCGDGRLEQCQVTTLDNGDRVRTYRETRPTDAGDGVRVVAELLTADSDLRVVAAATNGFDLPANRWEITRSVPVLDWEQLTQIVTQRWWGLEVPQSLVDDGAELTPYDEMEASDEATLAPAIPS